MPHRPRLLIIGPLPPPRGGVSVWTELLLASDVGQRWRVDVLDTSPSGPVSQEQPFYPQRIVPGLWHLGQLLVRARPDVAHIHSNLRWSLLRAALMAEVLRARGVPTVIHLHGGDVAERLGVWSPPARALVLRALRRARRVVVMTGPTCAWLRAWGVEAVQLPNFVDTGPFGRPPAAGVVESAGGPPEAMARAPAPRTAPARVLFVGAVMPAKGVLELLEAVAGVPGLHLDLAGSFLDSRQGSSRELILGRVDRLGLGSRVTLHGALPPARLRELTHRADLFALPSHREGWPLAVMEAMAAGLPVVVTAVGGLPELVTHGETGLVVPPRDVPALTAALARLVAHPVERRRLGEAAARRARDDLDTARVLPRLEATWRAACARPAVGEPLATPGSPPTR